MAVAERSLLRAATVGEIVDYVHEGTNVTVVGMHASGRTTVLRRAVEQLAADGVVATHIRGVRSLRDRPMGALAVAGLDPGSGGPLHGLAAAVDSLGQRLSSKPSVLIVDDADELDPTSVGVISAVHGQLEMPVLMATRPAARRGARDRTLAAELRPGAHLQLAPLTFDEVHRYIHTILDVAVDPSTVARIAALSGGLPGLVAAMVDHCRHSLRIVLRDGLWYARDDLWTASLSQAVEPYLGDLDDEHRDALTVLSYADSLTLDVAQRAFSAEVLTGLDDAGLLQVVPIDDEAIVGVFPPLVAEYVTHQGSATRRLLAQRRLAELAEGPETSPLEPAGALSATEHVLSQRLSRYWWDQRRVSKLAWENDPTPATAVPLLRALLMTGGRLHELDRIRARTTAAGRDRRADASYAAWTARFTALAGHRAANACEQLATDRTQLAEFDGLLRSVDAQIQLLAEQVPGELADAAPGEDDLSHQALAVVRAEAAVAAGRAREALDLLRELHTDDPDLRLRAELAQGLALIMMCDFDTAIPRAKQGIERARRALDPSALEGHAYVAGLGLALQGRVLELEELTSSALAVTLTPAHSGHYLSGLLTLAAVAAKWQRRSAYANSLAIQSAGLGHRRGPNPYMSPDTLAALVRDGDEDRTADELWELAAERMEHGYLPAGIVAGISAIEHRPDPQRAAVVEDAARRCDSPLLAHLGAYAVAVASGEADRLAEVEPVLRESGMRMYAVRAAVTQAMNLLEAGDAAGAIRRADTAWDTAGLRGRDLCGLFIRFDRAVNLTTRERQIAIMVAKGLSSPDIAARMVLSVRTVENHIFNACHKVGVDTREGLARAARTWLSCTPPQPVTEARPAHA